MAHYFSEKQDAPANLKKITISLKNRNFKLYSGSGVFSKEGLDKGTEVLIENAIIEEGWNVLDLGCGIGAVGISIKLQHPDTEVLMSDINERAVMISRKNIELHNLEGIKAVKSDVFSNIQDKFDTILLNPPQTAGKDVCFKMIEDSYMHLNKEGLLQLVARHKKGGLTLMKKMGEVFGNVDETAKKSGFRVYVSRIDNSHKLLAPHP
jgi:16S rRNA (guanine1207-N2)-methyltransferase